MCKLYSLNLSSSGFGKCKANPLDYFKGNIKIDDFKCNADICVVKNNVMSYDVIVGMNVLMQGETVINENGIVIKEKFQRIEEVDSLSTLPIDVIPNKVELNIGPDVPNIFKDKYLDDIIILSSSFEEGIERIERVLSIASEYCRVDKVSVNNRLDAFTKVE
ncbi:hypothetical protein AVEN_142023-1 [Araneus ventricosus]|uniref:Uncharacterized protein n=1 Tax=Araneus ventricosus TaxID=182803 RepID=A0A4Y2UPX4_ARAVE|nr:hypothetical protein AVEN_142023-1 [Araneus ventricosus]